MSSVEVKTYKSDNDYNRDAAKRLAQGWRIASSASRTKNWRLLTGPLTNKGITTVTWIKDSAEPPGGSAGRTAPVATPEVPRPAPTTPPSAGQINAERRALGQPPLESLSLDELTAELADRSERTNAWSKEVAALRQQHQGVLARPRSWAGKLKPADLTDARAVQAQMTSIVEQIQRSHVHFKALTARKIELLRAQTSAAESVTTEEPAREPVGGGPSSALTSELLKLKELHDVGVLTDDEFSLAKQQLLKPT